MSTLLELDWPSDLCAQVDSILLALARKSLSGTLLPTAGLPRYHAVLYAWRTHRDDFRGAAEVTYEYLQYLRMEQAGSYDVDDERLLETYLVLINTLATCGADEAWILVQKHNAATDQRQTGFNKKLTNGPKGSSLRSSVTAAAYNAKRSIVTLEDLRKEYTLELDRRNEVMQGRYGIVGDAMDLF